MWSAGDKHCDVHRGVSLLRDIQLFGATFEVNSWVVIQVAGSDEEIELERGQDFRACQVRPQQRAERRSTMASLPLVMTLVCPLLDIVLRDALCTVNSSVSVSPEEYNNWFSWERTSGTFSVLCANAGFNSGYMLASVHRRRVQDGFFLVDDLVKMLRVQRFWFDSGITLTRQVFGNESHTFSSCRWTRRASLSLVLQVDLGSCVLFARAVRTW